MRARRMGRLNFILSLYESEVTNGMRVHPGSKDAFVEHWERELNELVNDEHAKALAKVHQDMLGSDN